MKPKKMTPDEGDFIKLLGTLDPEDLRSSDFQDCLRGVRDTDPELSPIIKAEIDKIIGTHQGS